MKEYLKKIYDARYFWIHLAKADLKYKFRRSKLGILWSFLNPLILTLLMSIVFGVVFKTPITEYAPYILSGLVVWDLIVNSVVGGGNAIMSGEAYIRQFNNPISIYPLKATIVNIVSFFIANTALIVWISFYKPENILIGIITLPLTFLLLFLVTWPIVIISSLINTKYRDFGQVMALVLQALWYVSPVFFKGEMFKTNKYVETFFHINPVTHILNLLREPFLNGKLPSYSDYLYVLALIVVLFIFSLIKIRKDEKQIIFYL